jgi:hypothetical protein
MYAMASRREVFPEAFFPTKKFSLSLKVRAARL